ncbi:hypothetical protein FGO68_gene15194 [Halteria grandinella]|uniref:Histidine-type phosphatase n=1 Tax=Halteria grandinella TaxID=5974 RepID=A0A8J8NRT7_HALGN|nr:hypothetical protein FGO68_gene15194 [Halteria grandinella]
MSFKSAFHLPFACLFTFSIFLTLNALCALASDPIDRRLAYVIDITRHGSRAPKYQDDLNATEVYYEEPEGEITPLGQRQLYLRGREIRRRYIDQTYFLKAQYDPEELEVHSAFTQRCLASAQSFILGLYPPGTAEPYNPKIDSFPPFSLDNLQLLISPYQDKFRPLPRLVPIQL